MTELNDRFWHSVDVPNEKGLTIIDYISNFLKGKFPDYRIIGQYFEIGKIDFYIVEEKLPVEAQATPMASSHTPSISRFEQISRNQIEENIKILGKCWFFFDEKLLRYLQRDVTRATNIQFDWLYRFMKEGKLTIFTVDYDGNIQERCLEDFNFISKISVTCEVGKNNDKRILEQNKFDILRNILDYYNVTQKDLDNLGKEYKKNKNKNEKFSEYMTKTGDERKKLIGRIFMSMGELFDINEILDGNIFGRKYALCVYLGLFESEGVNNKNNRLRLVDKSNIGKYFPAYIRNKDKWESIKGKWLTSKRLEGVIKGNFNLDWYKL